MNQKLTVLIVEDHPMVSTFYKSAFEQVANKNETLDFNISTAANCDSANEQILVALEDENKLDFVFLDINLPSSKDGKILSGEDLGLKIRNLLPETKILVSTTHYDSFRIMSIIRSINPDGFIVKNDFDTDKFIEAIETVILNPPFYSPTVLTAIRQQITSNYLLDNIDRQLLQELSNGTKMKEIPGIIAMSMAGVEKRKRQLKEKFGLQKKDDRALICIAKEKGFI